MGQRQAKSLNLLRTIALTASVAAALAVILSASSVLTGRASGDQRAREITASSKFLFHRAIFSHGYRYTACSPWTWHYLLKASHISVPCRTRKICLSRRLTNTWLRSSDIFPEMWGFTLAMKDEFIPTRNCLKCIIKNHNVSVASHYTLSNTWLLPAQN